MNLNDLADNTGSRRKRKRVGRGIGSGHGSTAGRGTKGQKSRSGVSLIGFEGGQMPLYRRLPKRGFNKPNRQRYQELTLARLQAAVDAGKIDASAEITEDALVSAGVVRRKRDGVRLIGGGDLSAKVKISVSGASKSATAAVEKAGGSITVSRPAATSEAPAANDPGTAPEDGDDASSAEESEAAPADDDN